MPPRKNPTAQPDESQPEWLDNLPDQEDPAPRFRPTGNASVQDVEKMIRQALARQDEKHNAELEALRKSYEARLPDNWVPNNSAGIGIGYEETWSQYDQERANRGEHPLQAQD
jgi:hypothetical protein